MFVAADARLWTHRRRARPVGIERRTSNHLVCSQKHRLWDREAERGRGPNIDHQLKLRGLLDRQRAPGLAPLRILSTYVAARRCKSAKFAPYDMSPPTST